MKILTQFDGWALIALFFVVMSAIVLCLRNILEVGHFSRRPKVQQGTSRNTRIRRDAYVYQRLKMQCCGSGRAQSS